MRLGIAAMLLMTAVGCAQTITWLPDGGYVCAAPDSKGIFQSNGVCREPTAAEIAAHKPKPHKRKPSVKPSSAHIGWDKGLPCDGLACTGPVEMLPKPEQKPADKDTSLTTIGSYLTFNYKAGPCDWTSFTYDEKTKTCSMRITFSVEGQLVCTPLTLNDEGLPAMTCSYKPHDDQKVHP